MGIQGLFLRLAYHFAESVEREGLLVESNLLLDIAEELGAGHTLADAGSPLLVGEDILGEAGDGLVVHVGHAVLCELLLSHNLGVSEKILFGDFELALFGDGVADELPLEVGNHLGILLVDVLGVESLIIVDEPALEDFVGELEVAVALNECLAGVGREYHLAVAAELSGDEILHSLEVFLLVVDLVGAEYAGIELLVVLGVAHYDDFGDGELEVGIDFSRFLLVDVEHRGDFGGVAVAGVAGIEDNLVAHLLVLEFLTLLVRGEELRAYNCRNDLDGVLALLDAAVGVELHHRALDEAVGLGHFAGLLLAEALAESFVLLLHHLVAYFDGIVGDVDILVELDVELGSESEVILESEVGLVLEVKLHHFHGHGVAENFEFVVLDVFDDCAVHHLVDDIAGDLTAEAALKVGYGYMAFAEAGDGVGLAYLFEVFFYFICIIGCNDVDGESCADIRCLLHIYVHEALYMIKEVLELRLEGWGRVAAKGLLGHMPPIKVQKYIFFMY